MSSSSSTTTPTSLLLLLLLLFLTTAIATSQATVSPSNRFRNVNEGPVADYPSEYFTDYRPLDVFFFPFRLCFYNSTPDVYYLGIKMGHHRTSSLFRWVWDANRSHPVRENATLTFGANGNLVLADADGTVAWSTGTAGRGVVGLKMLPNGNMVLHDRRGRFVWQSFDHPSDTFLVGQSLRRAGPTKITGRVSDRDGSDGPHSLVLEPRRLALYYRTASKPLVYYDSSDIIKVTAAETLSSVAFHSSPDSYVGAAYDLKLDYETADGGGGASGTYVLSRPKFNATLSFLRLESDGNLRIYTFFKDVDFRSWEVTFTLFARADGDGLAGECGLPSRCGSLGICQGDQCVGCPTARGSAAWSRSCAPPVLPPCKGGAAAAASVNYYKVVGVEHFASRYDEGQGPMRLAECRDRCGKDCGCVGFFYREESSKCLLVPVLGTLTRAANSSHVGYIKVSS